MAFDKYNCCFCGKHVGPDHNCILPLVYDVLCEDDDPDDPGEVCANGHLDAAEKYVEETDDSRNLAASEGSEDVKVRLKGEEKWRKFRVSGRISVDYHAKEIE